MCNLPESILDLVGNVWNYLDTFSKKISPSLLFNDRGVDLAGGDVVAFWNVDVEESLVGSDVHVSLASVFCDEDLAVDVRVHRSCIIVEVRVDFGSRDL